MECENNESVRLRGRLLQTSRGLAVEGSVVSGLSSEPSDEVALELCANPQPWCQVMTGIFTSYYPAGTEPAAINAETEQMLAIVSDELAQNNWNGMTLSYANEPFGKPIAIEGNKGGGGDGGGGLSTGAIIGIAIAGFVVVVAGILGIIMFIRDKRNKKDMLPHQRTVPYGNAEQSHPKVEEDDSDSEESSSDQSSSSDDDDNTGVHSAPSAVSEDNTFSTFKTTMAQAQRQDIEQDDSSSETSSGSDEGSSSSNTSGSQSSVPKNDLNQLQKSDEDHVYVPDDEFIDEYDQSGDNRGYGEQNKLVAYPNRYNDREFEEYAMQNNAMAYRKLTSQGSGSSGGSSGSRSRGSKGSMGSIGSRGSRGSMGSANSADPPGTSYRDLPASEYDEWGNPDQHHYNDDIDPYEQHRQPIPDEDVSQPPPDDHLYEKNSMGSSDQNISRGSHHSRDSHRSNENGESYNSFNEGDNRQFNDSYRSQHSHRSLGSRGSLHRSFENEEAGGNENVPGQVNSPEGSFNSLDENDGVYNGQNGIYDEDDIHPHSQGGDQYDDSQYAGDQFNDDPYYNENQFEGGHYNRDQYPEQYNNGEYLDGRYIRDQYTGDQYGDQYQERRYDDDDQFKGESFNDIRYEGQPYSNDDHYQDVSYDDRNHRNDRFSGDHVEVDRYDNDSYDDGNQNMGMTDDDAYHRSPPRMRMSGKDSKSFHSEENDDDEYDAHLRNRPVTTPTETLFKEEELDEQIDNATHTTETSYGTQVTERASNLTSAAQYHPVSSPMPEKEKMKSGNPSPNEEVYDEEEESIDNIFKSLSEIQTRLASKGKNKSSDSKKPKGSKNATPTTTPKDMYRASSHSGSNGWDHDGIVEDASEDGSRASTFAANAARNRRPQNGQWMEPVEEDEDF